MVMQKFKRLTAIALAATMIIGGSVTAFAADDSTTPATSGSTTGAGTSEGHVDKKVVSVILPTIADGKAPFAYTMDLERLIQETSGEKYSGVTFPSADSDTGVYFLSAANTYSNTSEELTVTSESSADVKLKVDVEVVSADTDITLVDSAPANTVTEPQLYLALKVGSETKVVKKGEKVSAEVTIAGVPGNFKTTVDNGEYVYSAIESTDSGFTAWNTSKISMTGAASKASAEGLTAPTLKVTWSWADPAATPTVPTVAKDSIATGEQVKITLPSGVQITEIQKMKTDGTYNTLPSEYYTLEDTEGGKMLTVKASMKTTYTSANSIKIVFSSGDPITIAIK